MNECKACSSKIRRIGVVFMQRIALKKYVIFMTDLMQHQKKFRRDRFI